MSHDVIISAITKPSMGWKWLSKAKDKIFFALFHARNGQILLLPWQDIKSRDLFYYLPLKRYIPVKQESYERQQHNHYNVSIHIRYLTSRHPIFNFFWKQSNISNRITSCSTFHDCLISAEKYFFQFNFFSNKMHMNTLWKTF